MTDRYLRHEIFRDFPPTGTRGGLLVVVHEDPARVNALVHEEAEERGWPFVSLNADLAPALLDVRPADRSRATDAFMRTQLGDGGNSPMVISEIDLLFTPELGIDPLRLLTTAGQQCPIVVGWPGTWDGRILTYAIPEHGHYRHWQSPAATVRTLY